MPGTKIISRAGLAALDSNSNELKYKMFSGNAECNEIEPAQEMDVVPTYIPSKSIYKYTIRGYSLLWTFIHNNEEIESLKRSIHLLYIFHKQKITFKFVKIISNNVQ